MIYTPFTKTSMRYAVTLSMLTNGGMKTLDKPVDQPIVSYALL